MSTITSSAPPKPGPRHARRETPLDNALPICMSVRSSSLIEEGRRGSAWSVPWSDLMMVMFILFLVLFIYTNRSGVLSKDVLRSRETPDMLGSPSTMRSAFVPADRNLSAVHARLQEDLSGYSNVATVSISREGNVLVALHGETFFSPGRAELNLEAAPVLQAIAHVLSLAKNQVFVTGFSDFHEGLGGTTSGDLELSAMRAVRVTCFFTDHNSLFPEMFLVQGQGSSRPLVPASAPTSERNQRVEITITGRPV
jgi:chemotaxis protein MotB